MFSEPTRYHIEVCRSPDSEWNDLRKSTYPWSRHNDLTMLIEHVETYMTNDFGRRPGPLFIRIVETETGDAVVGWHRGRRIDMA